MANIAKQLLLLSVTLLLWQHNAHAQTKADAALGFGTAVTTAELSRFFAIQPDGTGLPDGSGVSSDGEKIFANECAMCHGDKLQGIPASGAPPLAGGRGTLTRPKPLKTVESYWPYATTLFDYIKRAMPFNAPGSLTNDQVYALVAFILSKDRIIRESEVMNKSSLPEVKMPNRNGFRTYHWPDTRLFR